MCQSQKSSFIIFMTMFSLMLSSLDFSCLPLFPSLGCLSLFFSSLPLFNLASLPSFETRFQSPHLTSNWPPSSTWATVYGTFTTCLALCLRRLLHASADLSGLFDL